MNKSSLKAFFNYYRQIVIVNLVISGLGSFIPIGYAGIKGHLTTFMLVFFIVGLIGAFYIFEWRHKKTYFFYFNLGLSRWHLYIGAFLINTGFYIPLLLIWNTL